MTWHFFSLDSRRNHKFGAQIPRELGIHGNLYFFFGGGMVEQKWMWILNFQWFPWNLHISACGCLWHMFFFLVASWISSGLEVAICLFEHWVTQSFMVNHHVLTFTPMLQYFMGIYHSSLDKSKDIQRWNMVESVYPKICLWYPYYGWFHPLIF